MEQVFHIFPDSAVHVGDRWKLSYTEHESINLVNASSYQLKEITDGDGGYQVWGASPAISPRDRLMGLPIPQT
jgi:hypothetical protein